MAEQYDELMDKAMTRAHAERTEYGPEEGTMRMAKQHGNDVSKWPYEQFLAKGSK